jgi:hypothetical protein
VCVSDLQSIVPSGVYKGSINPFTKPYPIYIHTPLNHGNIKMYLKEIGWEGVNWIHLSLDSVTSCDRNESLDSLRSEYLLE